MGPGHVLLDIGYQNATILGGGGNRIEYPRAVLKAGTSLPGLEVDLILPSYARHLSKGTIGSTDTIFGLREQLVATPTFAFGVNAYVSVPSGTPAFSSGAGKPTVYGGANAQFVLSPGTTIIATLGVHDEASMRKSSQLVERYTAVLPSLEAVFSFGGTYSLYTDFGHASQASLNPESDRTRAVLGIATVPNGYSEYYLQAGRDLDAPGGTGKDTVTAGLVLLLR